MFLRVMKITCGNYMEWQVILTLCIFRNIIEKWLLL